MASITGDTLQEQIQKAISAHGIFKFKLAHMVEAETGEIQPPTASADDRCPVGQWLYESLSPDARLSEHYRTVVELHARFHHAAGEVAALSIARRRTEALEAMELTSTFKKTSDQLVQAMEEWADAVAAGEPLPAASEALAPSQPEEGAEGEPPAGWWLDSPTALATEASEIALDQEEKGESAEPGGAEEQPEIEQPAESEERPKPAQIDGATDISGWFGLPKGLGDEGSEANEAAAGEEPPEPVEGDEAQEPAEGNPEETEN